MKSTVRLQTDLAAYIADMVALNGFDADGYVNNLIERGIRDELLERADDALVRRFMHDLATNETPNWKFFDEAPECARCHRNLGEPGIDFRSEARDPNAPSTFCNEDCFNLFYGQSLGTKSVPADQQA